MRKKDRNTIFNTLRKWGVFIIAFAVVGQTAVAQQDASYSQYMFNTPVLNPAAVGVDGATRAILLYKKQWMSMPGAPKGQSFSLDGPLKSNGVLKDKLGIGLYFVGDQFGPNKNIGVFTSVSYKFTLGKSMLSLGLKGGLKSYSIDWGKIEYASGYKAGTDYKHGTNIATLGFGARYASKRWHLGMALDNLTEPSLGLQRAGVSAYGSLYRIFRLSSGYSWSVTKFLDFEPSIFIANAKNKNGEFRINGNLVLNKKYWLGLGVHERGADFLLGSQITKSLMLGVAFASSVAEISANTGSSVEIILAYEVKRKDPELKLHLVSEDSTILMIAKKGKDYFYFEELPEQSTYLFKLESDDPDLLAITKEVEVHYKNSKGEDLVVTVTKDKDEFFRYEFLPQLKEDVLYAINKDGDTVGTALKNTEGYFIFEYLPNDRDLVFVQNIKIEDKEMLITVMINDKEIKLAKGEDKYFRFEALPPEVVKLYLLGENGDTLGSAGLNADGFFVFEKLPVDQNYLFFLQARDAELIDQVQIKEVDKSKVHTLDKSKDKFFRFDFLEHEESKLYLLNETGDTLMFTKRNADGFFVFEKLPVDQSFIFMMDGEASELIEDVLILTKDEKGKDKIITAAKGIDNKFRYESLPLSEVADPGMLEPNEVAFILNTQDQRILNTTYESLKFNTGESIIKLESYPYMEALSKMLILNGDWRIVLSGFTDNVGADGYNLLLSKQRAETVKRALVKRAVPSRQIRVKFYGESHPLESNDTEDGRQKNRRVEMRIVRVVRK